MLGLSATGSAPVGSIPAFLAVEPPVPVTTVPGKPIITEISASDGLVKVWFLPPVSDGGSPIISYQLALSDGTVVPATASPATAPAANGVTVVAVLKAINENGIGPASDQSASVTPQATTGEIIPMNFTPSVSRSIRILPGRVVYEVGSFWTVSGTTGPVGTKDPNATIDVSFDWTAWLADIGNVPLADVFFILGGGLESEGAISTPVGGTVFVSGGALNTDCTITCRITTDTVPVRIEDRTAVLRIRDQ